MSRRLVDWIWHVTGSIPLPPGRSGEDALDRLVPLFLQGGTTHRREADTLTFAKKDQAAQDRMSIFDGGVLSVEDGAEGPVLRYRLVSRALLFCFLAPLFFLGIAGITIGLNAVAKPPAKEAKDSRKKDVALPQNPIDKALGAPAPEKPSKKDKDKPRGRDKKPTPTPAYVFASIFLALYVGGRILEAWLVRRLFRNALSTG